MNEEQTFERFVADSVAGDRRGVPLREERYLETQALARRTRQYPRWLALVTERPMRTSSVVTVGSPTVRVALTAAASLLAVALVSAAGIAGQQLLTDDEPVVSTDGSIIVDASGAGDFKTIAEAVDAAVDGDTIVVRPGRYAESVVVMGKDLTIRGDGAREDIVLEATSGSLPIDYAPASGEDAPDMPGRIPAGEPYAWGILLADTNTELSGLTVVGPNVGTAIPIIGAGSEATLSDIVVRVPGPASGQWLSVNWTEGTRGSMRGSEVEGWLAIGREADVVIDDNILPATCLVAWDTGANIVITRNQLHGCPYEKGIDINEANTVLIEGNDIWVEDVPPDATVDGYSGGRPAIQVAGPQGSVTIKNNELHHSLYGIIVNGDGPELEIVDNHIHDNGVGVSGVDDLSILSGNEITENFTGVEVPFFVSPVLERNLIGHNQVGLSIGGNSEPEFRDNDICGNAIDVQAATGNPLEVEAQETCEEVPA